MKSLLFLFALSFVLMQTNGQEIDQEKRSFGTRHLMKLQATDPLMEDYDLCFLWIDAEVTAITDTIAGFAEWKAKVLVSGFDTLRLQLTDSMDVDSVWAEGVLVSHIHQNHYLDIPLPLSLNAGDYVTVRIWFHGDNQAGGAWRGLNHGVSSAWGNQASWTLSESFHLKDWLPCKEDLADRIDSAWIFLTCDTAFKAGSNGVLTQIIDLPGGKARYEWKTNYPMVYYLISFAVGEYVESNYTAYPDNYPAGIFIQNYIYKNPLYEPANNWYIYQSVPVMEYFSENLILYPFAEEKYGHCLVPLGGGMEHQTMTTLGSFDVGLVAHEMAHMWFGDYITCANWQDIWVNEGFASYCEYIINAGVYAQFIADGWLEDAHRRSLQEPYGSVYVPFASIWDEGRIFNYNLSYKKGASIIHMMRYMAGNDSLFYQSLREMLTRYSDSLLTGADVRDVFEDVTGNDYSDFFDQWYYGEGFPIYRVTWNQIGSDFITRLEQNGSSGNTPLFTIPVELKLYAAGYDTTITLQPATNIDVFHNDIGLLLIDSIEFDPNNWVLDSVLSISQGIAENSPEQPFVSVFPNPATEGFWFNWGGADRFDGNIILTDMRGREIRNYPVLGNNVWLKLDGVEPGMYLVVIEGNHVSTARKTLMIH